MALRRHHAASAVGKESSCTCKTDAPSQVNTRNSYRNHLLKRLPSSARDEGFERTGRVLAGLRLSGTVSFMPGCSMSMSGSVRCQRGDRTS